MDLAMQTINDLLAVPFTLHAQRPALGQALETCLTYAEVEGLVRRLATGLIKAGIRRGDRVAILAENSPRWGIAYLGAVRIGAAVVPILPDFTGTDVRHILQASGAQVLFTSSRQLEKILELEEKVPRRVVLLDEVTIKNAPVSLTPFGEFLARQADDRKVAALAGRVKPEDTASLIYTSGTSGRSKAVVLSHANLAANAASAQQVVPVRPGMTFLSLLPMSHAYEFTCGFLAPLACGCRVVYAGVRPSPTLLGRICRQERPNVICVVPMVVEKIYKKRVLPQLTGNRLFRFAQRVPGVRQRLLRAIGNKLKDFFGGALEILAIGGAALNREVEEFLRQAEFPFVVGYGLTETAPLVAAGPFGDPTVALGSCGKPVPGVRVRIVNPQGEQGVGEIHVQGPNVMAGYLDNKELTSATIDGDGWLATGDLGYLDQAGNLHVVGRSKSVIVLSHGENVYPETIEDLYYGDPLVAECLVVEREDRLVALIHPDYDWVDGQTRGASEEERRLFVEQALDRLRRRINDQLPPFSQVRQALERPDPFIKTATQKIKRFLYVQ